jgi:hypothetical protein
MLQRGFGVPKPVRRVLDLREQLNVLTPRQSSNDPLDNFRVRPCLGEGPHIEEVGPGEALRALELGAQVERQPIDHLGAPSVALLALQNVTADAPIEPDQLSIDR